MVDSIGLFDSGIGGLTVAREIHRLLPRESTLYVGDTARVPYGNRSPETVRRFSFEILDFLLEQKVKVIIVACSTATAHALPELIKRSPVPVYGVIKPAVTAALSHTKTGKIAVIGTRGTIQSKSFETAINHQAPSSTIYSQACPLFVPLAEEGITSGPIAESIAHHYLSPLTYHQPDVMILGCTHYPVLSNIIQKEMGPEVTLINPGVMLAKTLKQELKALNLLSQLPTSTREYYCTDSPTLFAKLANRFLYQRLESLPVQITF